MAAVSVGLKRLRMMRFQARCRTGGARIRLGNADKEDRSMNETRVGELIGNVIVVGVLLFLAWAILHDKIF